VVLDVEDQLTHAFARSQYVPCQLLHIKAMLNLKGVNVSVHLLLGIRCVYWRETCADNAILRQFPARESVSIMPARYAFVRLVLLRAKTTSQDSNCRLRKSDVKAAEPRPSNPWLHNIRLNRCRMVAGMGLSWRSLTPLQFLNTFPEVQDSS
jgi:hypothetical protein